MNAQQDKKWTQTANGKTWTLVDVKPVNMSGHVELLATWQTAPGSGASVVFHTLKNRVVRLFAGDPVGIMLPQQVIDNARQLDPSTLETAAAF